MKNQPLVSVIIPAYNRDKYIEQTVNSVLNQSYSNIELIIVDDGSTDGTRAILESYGENFMLLQHENSANKGQSASINAGLRHAKGKYIAIMDSDDYWEPDKIQIQVDYLQQNPAVGLVYCNGTAVDSEGNYLYDIYGNDHHEHNNPENVLLDCYFHVPVNALVRSSVMKKVGYFDESLRSGQDHDIAIRIAEITNLAYINRVAFHYRRHLDSISYRNAELRWNNGFIILEKARKRYPYSLKTIFGRKAVLHFRLFQCDFENRKYISSFWHLLLSGIFDPVRACRVVIRKEKVLSHH